MDITIHWAVLPNDDADASLAFYRDALGFEVHNDVAYEPAHDFGGGRLVATVTDPDGNVFGLLQDR